jgi:transcriptional regulator with XRE-family HTH domain
MDIGRRVREVREDLGMQRTVLARRVGVAENTIYRIETGKRTPSVELLEKIARELRTEPAEFLREPVPLDEAPGETGQPEAREPTEVPWAATVAEVREKYLPIAAVLNDYCRVYERLLEREELTDDDAVKFARTAVDAKDFHTAVIESELVELGVALDERGGLEEGSPLRDLSVLRDAFSRYYRLMRAIREAGLLPDGEEKTALAELAARNA